MEDILIDDLVSYCLDWEDSGGPWARRYDVGELAGAGSRFFVLFRPVSLFVFFWRVGCYWVWALAFILIYSIFNSLLTF